MTRRRRRRRRAKRQGGRGGKHESTIEQSQTALLFSFLLFHVLMNIPKEGLLLGKQ